MTSEILKARVDKATARRVQAWAREHDTDVSDTIRRALAKLLDEADRAKQAEDMRRKIDKAARAGLFDPPADDAKMGGFR